VRVEQSSAPDGGTATSDRYVMPPYIPVAEPSSPFANSDGLVAAPNVDLGAEIIEQIGAQQSYEASLRSIQSMSDLVKKLYDLTE